MNNEAINLGSARVRNSFDFELTNTSTGEVTNAKAYNMVLDSYYTELAKGTVSLSYIHVGSGTGTIASTDNVLFKSYGAFSATTGVPVLNGNVGSVVRTITLGLNQCNGLITEVGLGSSTNIRTHALLKDAEGNPISITKTNLDVLTIRSTIYFTLNFNNTNCLLPSSLEHNFLFSNGLGITNPKELSSNMYLGVVPITSATDMSHAAVFTVSAPRYTNKTITWGPRRLSNTEFNVITSHGAEGNGIPIKSMGIPGLCAWNLNEGIFAPKLMQDLPIGTGDGVRPDFSMPIYRCVEDSQVLYINGVEVPKSEYTFIPQSACNSTVGTSHYAFPHYNLSNYWQWPTELVKSNTESFCEMPIPHLSGLGLKNTVGYSDVIYDFGKPETVNYFYYQTAYSSGYTQNQPSLYYSHDNVIWTKLFGISNAAQQRVDTPIVARYWKLSTGTGAPILMGRHSNFNNVAQDWYTVLFGYDIVNNITFNTPSPVGVSITMDCVTEYPIKNKNWVMDISFYITLE